MLDTIPRYFFNGKELDEESGLSYYEARYLDSKFGGFISRDPHFARYWWISPYAYCANNPVRWIDPTGRDPEDPLMEGNINIQQNQENTQSGSSTEIKPVNEKNKQKVNKTSWGETKGLYPTENTTNPSAEERNNPKNWSPDKLKQLLKARAAIALIGKERNTDVHNETNDLATELKRILAPYHLEDNFPEVDAEIKNDAAVKYFYLSDKQTVSTTAISSKWHDQECVKTYGPFYNIGGGDAPKGAVYIHFYKAVPKKTTKGQ